AASAAVAVIIAAHAMTPTRNTQIRAVPRSRIVARSERDSSCSAGGMSAEQRAIVAHSSADNAVAVYELSARIQEPKIEKQPTFLDRGFARSPLPGGGICVCGTGGEEEDARKEPRHQAVFR